MSKQSIRSLVARELLVNYNRTAEKLLDEAARIVGQSAAVSQCVILDEESLEAYALGFEAGVGRSLSSSERAKYKSELKTTFAKMSAPFPDTRVKGYFLQILKSHRLKLNETKSLAGGSVYYIPVSFPTIKTKVHKFNKEFAVSEENAILKDTNSYDAGAVGSVQNLDHGLGSSGVTSIIGTTKAMSIVSKGLTPDQEKELKTVFMQNFNYQLRTSYEKLSRGQKAKIRNSVRKLILNWHQYVDPKTGEVNAGLGILLKNITKDKNLEQSSIEKAEVDLIFKTFEQTIEQLDFINIKGSSTLLEKIEKSIVLNLESKLKNNKNVKVTQKRAIKKASLKTKAKVEESIQSKSKKVSIRSNNKGITRKASFKRTVTKGVSSSPLYLIGILNKQLPSVIQKNMESPRLNNQTGRLAASVNVTDITQTPKGYPSIGYTYMKYPYQTFEPGYAQGDITRDPRKLIDYSIREIAAQYAIGRFYTRRV